MRLGGAAHGWVGDGRQGPADPASDIANDGLVIETLALSYVVLIVVAASNDV